MSFNVSCFFESSDSFRIVWQTNCSEVLELFALIMFDRTDLVTITQILWTQFLIVLNECRDQVTNWPTRPNEQSAPAPNILHFF